MCHNMGNVIMKIKLIYYFFVVNFSNITLFSQFGGGSGTETDPYQIWNKNDLMKLFDSTYYSSSGLIGKHFKLMTDIDNVTHPIADRFYGHFHGNYKKLTINLAGAIFYVLSGTIDNLIVDGYATAAGIVGGTYGNGVSISHCINNVIVTSTSEYGGGGISPNNNGITISNCINNGDITGVDRIGGIAGENGGQIINCINTGKITATASGDNSIFSGVGGICGTIANSSYYGISNCVNTGTVVGQGFVGGIIGLANGNPIAPSPITNCVNYGYIKGTNAVGGILGYMYNQNVNISNCVNAGVVEGKSDVGSITGKE